MNPRLKKLILSFLGSNFGLMLLRLALFRWICRLCLKVILEKTDRYLPQATGVVHIGANTGQERYIYCAYGLQVIWIEPIPEVADKLKKNIIPFPKQRAFQYLVTEQDGKDYDFHVSNNAGLSSSIFDFEEHTAVDSSVHFSSTIHLKSITLPSLIKKEQISLKGYNALVLDTQGSEYIILQGMTELLHHFRFIKLETADYELYKDYPQIEAYHQLLTPYGFKEIARRSFLPNGRGGFCYDVTFERIC